MMASSPFIISALLLFIYSFSSSSSLEDVLVLPIMKDQTTLQYTTVIHMGTTSPNTSLPGGPLVATSLVFDLGGRRTWVKTDTYNMSVSFGTITCNADMCYNSGSRGCRGCIILNSCDAPCTQRFRNRVDRRFYTGNLAREDGYIQSSDGSSPGPVFKKDLHFLSSGSGLDGLANGTVGIAGFGRDNYMGLPGQFNFREFAFCLPSGGRGVAFFAIEPHRFLPGISISELTTTRLLVKKVLFDDLLIAEPYKARPSPEYYFGLTAIKIDNKTLPINPSSFSFYEYGLGGATLSTLDPYTVLNPLIFKAFTSAFVTAASARNITQVPSVKPFGACFSTQNVSLTRLGYAVPEIQLVLATTNAVWRIFGANSMVSVSDDVICLAFVERGAGTIGKEDVVIGGYQLQDHFIAIDVEKDALRISPTLLAHQTTCADFNFNFNFPPPL